MLMKDTGKPTEQVDGKNKRFACVYEVAMTRMRRTVCSAHNVSGD